MYPLHSVLEDERIHIMVLHGQLHPHQQTWPVEWHYLLLSTHCATLRNPCWVIFALPCFSLNLASLYSVDSVANFSWWLMLICCSQLSLSSATSAFNPSCPSCRHVYLCSTLWAARLALSLTLRLANLSSLCSADSEAQWPLSFSPPLKPSFFPLFSWFV